MKQCIVHSKQMPRYTCRALNGSFVTRKSQVCRGAFRALCRSRRAALTPAVGRGTCPGFGDRPVEMSMWSGMVQTIPSPQVLEEVSGSTHPLLAGHQCLYLPHRMAPGVQRLFTSAAYTDFNTGKSVLTLSFPAYSDLSNLTLSPRNTTRKMGARE